MPSLAINMHISQVLKTKYQFCLAALPVIFMFSSFLLLYPFAYLSAELFGIPKDFVVKDHPNGLVWLIVFLIVMLTLMIAGYFFGWFLNSLIAQKHYGWSKEKIERVFKYSEVPDEWLKTDHKKVEQVSYSRWAKIRQKGKWNFIFGVGVFGWGGMMFIIMTVVPSIANSEQRNVVYYLINFLVWGGGGALFGFILWYISEKQYQNKPVADLDVDQKNKIDSDNKKENQMDKKKFNYKDVPVYGWIGIVLCGIIPFLTLGGAIPAVIGFCGAYSCYAATQKFNWSTGVKVSAVVGTVVLTWIVFVIFLIIVGQMVNS